MKNFIKSIETNYGVFDFYINEIETAAGKMFHVSVTGKDNETCMFLMEKQLNRWYIKSPVNCPDWIINIEPILSDTIAEYLRK